MLGVADIVGDGRGRQVVGANIGTNSTSNSGLSISRDPRQRVFEHIAFGEERRCKDPNSR